MTRVLSFGLSLIFWGVGLCASAQTTEKAPAATAPAAAAQATAAPAIAATVNGQPINEELVERGLERVPAAKRAEVRSELLRFLIDNVLVEQYLTQLKVPVEAADVDKKLAEMKAELKKSGKEYDHVLKEMHLTDAELKGHLTADLRWEKFAGERATPEALKQQFESNREIFNGTVVRARHILLTPSMTDAQAVEAARQQLLAVKQQVDEQVKAGLAKLPPGGDNLAVEKARCNLVDEAFAAAAKEKSTCPSKVQGGDVGWFQRTGIMVEPFARAAFALKPYTMSDVVQTRFGLHLILLTDRKNGQEVKFDDVKDEVRDRYFELLREAVVAQMRPRSKIEITPVKP